MKDKEKLIRRIADGDIPRRWRRDTTRMGWCSPKGRKFVSDLEVHEYINDHTCAICGDGPDEDIRWLRIACFYELHEVSRKFQVQVIEDKNGWKHRFYILPFCKPCRGHFMSEILGKWINSKGHKKHPNWNGESTLQYV